ncbi:hypothetical protein, partial [Haladaptatus sp.]|uniref:hypothetical protein n=1 Tax=Haladaptatus sp. TaxID=1973141 RepID=UPI003C3E722D
ATSPNVTAHSNITASAPQRPQPLPYRHYSRTATTIELPRILSSINPESTSPKKQVTEWRGGREGYGS